MSSGTPEGMALGQRLRQLRNALGLKQRDVSDGLPGDGRKVSVSLISSWETGAAVPSEQWLSAYAHFVAERDPGSHDPAELEAELLALRGQVPGPSHAGPSNEPGRRLGDFWEFHYGLPVRLVGTPMFPRWVKAIDYADPWHPNYIHSLRNADMDATITAVRRIDAANPLGDVRYMTQDELTTDDLTGHVVLLGGAEVSLAAPDDGGLRPTGGRDSLLARYLRDAKVPVFYRLPEAGDPEYDSEFVVTTDATGEPAYGGSNKESYPAGFAMEAGDRVMEHGYPRLEYDVGLLLRQPNPLNASATLTICSGIFSRGTYGVVRALTDPRLRDSNEDIIRRRFGTSPFWLLLKVPVVPTYGGMSGLKTATPDLTQHVLRSSS